MTTANDTPQTTQKTKTAQINLEWRLAETTDCNQVVQLVNSAYRGNSGRMGWTTES